MFQPTHQVLSAFPSRHEHKILCCYDNNTPHIQIIKITNVRDFYFEKVVFPKQRILFDALPEAQLEVFTSELMQAIVTDRILCQELAVHQPENGGMLMISETSCLDDASGFMGLSKISIKEDALF